MLRSKSYRLLVPPLLVACAGGAGLAAQAEAELPAPAALGEAATKALVGRFHASDHWVQKVVVLLSLNHWWHPSGSAMIVAAVRDKDARLNAFGIEALLRSEPGLLPKVATPELLDELIGDQLGHRNDHYGKRVGEALARLAPGAGATTKSEWSRWWMDNKATFAAEKWEPKEQPDADGMATTAASERAFDLHQHGLDLMICIDSTGSMQSTIDALGDALGEMVAILDGISPKLRLGIVHYKDYGELGKPGAKVVQPFSKNIKTAQKNLEKLRAHGGGDIPEAVLGGLELALSPKMRWKQDANKLVILIGDAPPHADDTAAVIALAKAANETPGRHTGKPVTGAGNDERPYLTSAIGVFVDVEGNEKPQGWREFVDGQKQMRIDFAAVAKAGGGVFVAVDFLFKMGPPPTSKDRKENQAKGNTTASAATRKIVEHILVLSFGERYAREMREFARVYYDYKAAELIK